MSTGEDLLFLVSQPRAGSTLLQRILSTHPDIHTVSEPWIALHPLFALRQQGLSANYSHLLARDATAAFLSGLPGGDETYYEGVRLMLSHLYGASLSGTGKSIFLDKTPRYYFIVQELRRVFPDARFIFLVRNPLAVFCSIMETWVKTPHFATKYALRNDLVHDLLTAPECIATAIASPGPNDAVIHYENLAQSPVPNIARLCQHLRLDFHPSMIEYGAPEHSAKDDRWTYGDQGTVYQEERPITERAERWQQVLRSSATWTELAGAYLQALGPGLIERLGYNYDGLRGSLRLRSDWHTSLEFLNAAVLTSSYGESCDYLSQFAYFQDLIARFAKQHDAGQGATKVVGVP